MSATEAIKAAARHGVQLTLAGNDLVMKAPVKPPVAVLDTIKRHKAEIVGLLREGPLDAYGFPVGQFERELGALKVANAEIYANPQPWKAKR